MSELPQPRRRDCLLTRSSADDDAVARAPGRRRHRQLLKNASFEPVSNIKKFILEKSFVYNEI